MAEPSRWGQSARCVETAPRALRVYRGVRGLSLREAADEIGVAHATLWRFEQGESVHSRHLPGILRWLDANRERVMDEVALDGS